jgi:DNA polymerase I-like protein with 3'-5' exonuclease and polymerase domains
MSYVQYCGKHEIEITKLIQEVLKKEVKLIEEKEVTGIGKKKKSIIEIEYGEEKINQDYVTQISENALMIYQVLKKNFEVEKKLFAFYNMIELPLIHTLSNIEMNGFTVFNIFFLTFF